MQSHWNSRAPRKDANFAEWCYYSQKTSLGWLPLWFSWYPVHCTSLTKQQKSCPLHWPAGGSLYQTRSFFFPPSYQQNAHSLNPSMPKSRSYFFFFLFTTESQYTFELNKEEQICLPTACRRMVYKCKYMNYGCRLGFTPAVWQLAPTSATDCVEKIYWKESGCKGCDPGSSCQMCAPVPPSKNPPKYSPASSPSHVEKEDAWEASVKCKCSWVKKKMKVWGLATGNGLGAGRGAWMPFIEMQRANFPSQGEQKPPQRII